MNHKVTGHRTGNCTNTYPIQFCLIFGSQFDPSLVDIFQLANVVNQMNQLYIRGNKGNKSYLQFKRLAIFLCGL
jgi:hypothetical protein